MELLKLYRGVTDATFKELTLLELEHLVDFSYAFKITVNRVAECINGIAGKWFDSKELAMTALVEAIRTDSPLIPAEPMALDSWRQHLISAASKLAGFSIERDTQGYHYPKGYRANCAGDTITIEPIFKKEYLPTENFITLDHLTTVFSGTIQ